LLEGGNVAWMPTAAAIVSTGRHSSHEFRRKWMNNWEILCCRAAETWFWTGQVSLSAWHCPTDGYISTVWVWKLDAPKSHVKLSSQTIFSANIVQPSSCPHGHHSSAPPWDNSQVQVSYSTLSSAAIIAYGQSPINGGSNWKIILKWGIVHHVWLPEGHGYNHGHKPPYVGIRGPYTVVILHPLWTGTAPASIVPRKWGKLNIII
jgi:hypothetical protein